MSLVSQPLLYTSDNNAVRRHAGAFLIALKIWQENASGFRRYGNYPREVTAPVTLCCHVLAAPYSHTLANHSPSIIDLSESHPHHHWTRVALNFFQTVPLSIIITSLFTIIHHSSHWNFCIGLHGHRYRNPHGIMGRIWKGAAYQTRL